MKNMAYSVDRIKNYVKYFSVWFIFNETQNFGMQ